MSYEYEKQIKDDLKALHEMRKFAEWRVVEMNIDDKYAELDHVYAQAAKSHEYEAKNKKLLEELKYLKKVNDDLVWQRDTDEEHESKAKAWDKYKAHMESYIAGDINEEEFVSDLESDYFESGEYDA